MVTQQEIFRKGISEEKDFYKQLKIILTDSLDFASKIKNIISIWLELGQSYNERFTLHTLDMEKDVIKFLKKMI